MKIEAKKKQPKHQVKPDSKKVIPVASKSNRYYIILFTVITFILYGNTLFNKYSMDDDFVVYNNKTVQKGVKAIPKIFTSLYSEGKLQYEYRPIVKISFALESQIFGAKPGVSHFFNILLFLATAVMLFYLLKKFLKDYNILFPVIIVILFIAHPIHTEVVASLKNRDALISFLSVLISLHFFVRYIEIKKIWTIFVAMFFFILGYLSKIDIMTFIVVIPLVLYFFTDAKPKEIFIVFTILVIAFFLSRLGPKLYLPSPDRQISFFENPLYFEKSIFIRTATGFWGLLFYLKLLILPHPLVFYYGYNEIPIVNFGNILVILSIIIHLALFVYAIMKIKEKHLLSFIILFYLVTISMFSNVLKPAVGIVAERFIYISSLSFCMAVAYFIFKYLKIDFKGKLIPSAIKNKVYIILLIILVPYSAKTISRNSDWKDFKSLYSADIDHLENSAKANTLYASLLLSEAHKNPKAPDVQEKLKMAIKYYEKAVEIYPKYATSLNNLGSIYFIFYQDYKAAEPYFLKALEAKPDYEESCFNLAFTYEKMGKNKKAKRYYLKAISIKPDYIVAYSNLANLVYSTGDPKTAIEINNYAMKAEPTSDMPYINNGNYCLLGSDTIKAVEWWEVALKKNPSNEKLCNSLGNYFRSKGNTTKSNYYFDLENKANRLRQKSINESGKN
ncbi:MAG: tetratricopeptide repeat protein [Bacteroidetes bacterium]|nr:tetratricopeptide repeat protein [Bacteroidota bacterium]